MMKSQYQFLIRIKKLLLKYQTEKQLIVFTVKTFKTRLLRTIVLINMIQ